MCGKVNSHAVGSLFAFSIAPATVEGNYVEGISLTHTAADNSLVHIWTFAVSLFEDPDSVDSRVSL